jgi:serine protease AprX
MDPRSLNPREVIRDRLRPTLVAEPLRSLLEADPRVRHHIIIDLNTRFPGGVECARTKVREILVKIAPESMKRNLVAAQHPYVFAELSGNDIDQLMKIDFEYARDAQAALPEDKQRPDLSVPRECRAIFKIWESAEIRPLTTVSIRTVKADAAQSAFAATGEGVVWAVLDSGINSHSHFKRHENLELDPPLRHQSFTPSPGGVELDPLQDGFGHGTHVAGIIAGALDDQTVAAPPSTTISNASASSPPAVRFAAQQSVDDTGKQTEYHIVPLKRICGMAPKCKLLSLRVLDDSGIGDVTAVINALEWIIQVNGDGSKPLVHGVNLSAGYLPDPENYGSGQSPICRQVNRAVRSGLIVVVAAGNFGYSTYQSLQSSNAVVQWDAGAFSSVADPGNADLAITVGSTHREEPHRYGISYFSSKGPTSDGRLKPDVVAPGERILSCAAGAAKEQVRALLKGAVSASSTSSPEANLSPVPAATPDGTRTPVGSLGTAAAPQPSLPDFDYLEDTGTSMAAPHVSGVIAAFLSIRHEFIGDPEGVAKLVLSSAMDLKREARLQGAGLVDLFRMLQSV